LSHKLAQIFPVIIASITTVLLPTVAQMNNLARLRNVLAHLKKLSVFVAVATVLTVWAVRPVMMLLFEEYEKSIPVLQILIIAFS